MVKRYRRRYVAIKLRESKEEFKIKLMSILNRILEKDERIEVKPLVIDFGKNLVVVRVPHSKLKKFKELLISEPNVDGIALVSGTLKRLRKKLSQSSLGICTKSNKN